MELDRLKEFAVIAKQKSMKKAAEELKVSPATLNARMHSFEKSLGVALFRREGRELSLTEAGNRLLPNATEILSDFGQLTGSLQVTSRHHYRKLRLAVAGGGLPLYLGPFLDQLNNRFPGLQLDLMDDNQLSIGEGLRSGTVDVYFASVMEKFQLEGIEKRPVAISNQYVLLPRQHPLSGRNSISIRELDGDCFILHPETRESCIRDFQMANLMASGIRYSIYQGQTASAFSKLLVPIGKGLVLTPTLAMDLPPNTVCVSISDLPYPATPCYFYRKDTENPETLAFVRDYENFVKEARIHEH